VGADEPVIQLVTRCNSADEFIERFARYTTATDLVVPALPKITIGTAGPFVVCLKDRSVMLKGRCEVTEIRPVVLAPGAGPSGLALMRLHLREMDAHSAGIHLRLMERHASWAGPPARSAPRRVVAGARSGAARRGRARRTAAVRRHVGGDGREWRDDRDRAAATRGGARARRDLHAAGESAHRSRRRRSGELHRAHAAREPGASGAGDAAPDAAFTDGPVETTSLVRAETRQERSRRIGRRAGPFAAIAALGLALGIAIGSGGASEAPIAAAIPMVISLPPRPAAPPPPAEPVAEALPDGDPIPAARKNTKRIRSHRTRAKRSHRGRSQHRGGAVAIR
jgi:hypothetical protein